MEKNGFEHQDKPKLVAFLEVLDYQDSNARLTERKFLEHEFEH